MNLLQWDSNIPFGNCSVDSHIKVKIDNSLLGLHSVDDIRKHVKRTAFKIEGVVMFAFLETYKAGDIIPRISAGYPMKGTLARDENTYFGKTCKERRIKKELGYFS